MQLEQQDCPSHESSMCSYRKIWYNYEIDRPFWSSYAGKSFTDRQRIKRKAERWAKNYASLPKTERLAILSAIMRTEQDETT